MKYSFFITLILALSGCASMAMDAAKKGDRKAMDRNLQYVNEEEKPAILEAYNTKVCGDVAAPAGPEEMMLLAFCNLGCKTPRFCDSKFALRLIMQAAQYGYVPARTFLTKAEIPLPKIDPSLASNWQAEKDREAREQAMWQLESSIRDLKNRQCVSEWKNGQLIENCN